MTNLILVVTINIIIAVTIWVGINYVNSQDKVERARERARLQYRNRGRFSLFAVKRPTPVTRSIKINEYGRTYFI